MKRYTVVILYIFCLITAQAAIKHPSLLFTPERVNTAKAALKSDTAMQNAWRVIQAEADRQVEGKGDVRRLEYPALAYMMTGDRKYADKIKDVLIETSKIKSWGDREMLARTPAWRSELQMAHRSFQVAVAYDVIYEILTPAERMQIAKGMYDLAVEPLLGDWILEPTRIHSLNSMGHNWWTSCAGMGGLLALAISNELPDAKKGADTLIEMLPEWFEFNGDVIQHKPRTFDRDGGMYESINYASFGTTEALLFRLAYLNSHPGTKLEDIPHMAKLASFFCHVAYPRDGELYSINFGDSHKNVTGESSMLLAYAMGEKSPETLWYVSQVKEGQHREGYPRSFPMGFLYTPDLSKTPATPDLPTSHLWKDFGWATMRDNWDKDATMLAVKSGMTWNHSHADANSFIIFHKGVDIIKDAGNCSYGKPEYRNYFFQSDAHNVVKFNGEGQPTFQQYHGSMLPGSVSSLIDGGNIKYVLADGTGPMSKHFNRNFRNFLWIDNVIFIIDDIGSHKPGHFEWLWHPGGEATKRGFDLEVKNGQSAVAVRPLYPRQLAYSNFVHDYPEDLYWEVKEGPTENLQASEEYYSFHLPETTDRVKAVTAIILKDSPDDKNLPVIERREGKNWIGLRMKHNGKITDLYINQLADGRLMHMNSWIEADGWNTDAYMFAVSYPEGGDAANPSETFIGHGSSLRRGDDVRFSSLSKLSMIAKNEGKRLNLQVTGQPRINIGFKASPSSMTVNGKTSPVTKSGSLVKVKLLNNK
ncbi:MAG: heparinase II/III-family protein [Muribaculaceae bacterium]|nr:heparinase II/III-family protein [Muribaculaceae bacterium]